MESYYMYCGVIYLYISFFMLTLYIYILVQKQGNNKTFDLIEQKNCWLGLKEHGTQIDVLFFIIEMALFLSFQKKSTTCSVLFCSVLLCISRFHYLWLLLTHNGFRHFQHFVLTQGSIAQMWTWEATLSSVVYDDKDIVLISIVQYVSSDKWILQL